MENTKDILINGENYEKCKLVLVEIYKGKDPAWKGWHNLVLKLENNEQKAIAGPIDPETSKEIMTAIKT